MIPPLPAGNFSRGSARRPNVLWVLTDQLRASALGVSGDPNLSTPNIDNLAQNGLWFRNAVAGAPWCCPFRGALVTGQYPHQVGTTETPSGLDPDIPTVAAPFNQAGYHTAYIGKWHLDGTNSHERIVPPERRGGFRYWLGYENNNNQFNCYVHGSGCEKPERVEGFETDGLTDLMIKHLREHVRTTGREEGDYQPFFACLSVQPPHPPFVAHPDFPKNPARIELRRNVPPIPGVEERARRGLAGYYSMIENVDWNVGRLFEALRELGIDEETYVVFFSDHGEMLGSHAKWHKLLPYEESLRIPFFIGHVAGQYRLPLGSPDAVINHVDIAPTSLGLCGITPPPEMVGYDYSGLCRRPNEHESAGTEPPSDLPESAFIQQYRGLARPRSTTRPWRGVVTRDGYKLACNPGNEWLFFNLREDPFELANAACDNRERIQRERCMTLLEEWIGRTGDTFELPPPGEPLHGGG